MITWMFQSPERLKRVAVTFALTCVALTILLTIVRVHDLASHRPPAEPTYGTTTESNAVATGLLPPSPSPEPAPATTEYGPATPIALEAAQAFLQGDRSRFAELAQPDVVESANEAPTPGGQITAPGRVLLGGPTQQKILVPTSEGDLTLTMIVIDGAWKVAGMEYAK